MLGMATFNARGTRPLCHIQASSRRVLTAASCVQYAHEVRTCDEIMRKIRFFREAAGKIGLTVQSVEDVPDDLDDSTINLVELVSFACDKTWHHLSLCV